MYDNWEELEAECKKCTKCKLCQGRKNVVIGVGNKEADIMFIGEGPGADEDAQGIPFVGKARKTYEYGLSSPRDKQRRSIYSKHSKMQTTKQQKSRR